MKRLKMTYYTSIHFLRCQLEFHASCEIKLSSHQKLGENIGERFSHCYCPLSSCDKSKILKINDELISEK